ncbi:unnamed protein product [Calicophoron daubneyi]|uniref:Uncharacterized protein n=1 Tax=Calicophoron daubneyi TaxID=300641 RepID=A0AAV2T2E2_CALDB
MKKEAPVRSDGAKQKAELRRKSRRFKGQVDHLNGTVGSGKSKSDNGQTWSPICTRLRSAGTGGGTTVIYPPPSTRSRARKSVAPKLTVDDSSIRSKQKCAEVDSHANCGSRVELYLGDTSSSKLTELSVVNYSIDTGIERDSSRSYCAIL